MKKFINLTVFSVLMAVFVHYSAAQISQGGTPISFTLGEKSLTQNVPMQVMPYVDVDALKAEDIVLDQRKDIPWRFGQNIEVAIDVKTMGTKDELFDGGTLWRIDIVSPGALSLNFQFDNFQIPEGSTLFIYNQDRSEVLGAFTEFNNRDDRIFATTLIRGDHITLEYYEPEDAAFEGTLHLSTVTHGYRGPEEFIKSFGSSGSCNVNVACPEAAPMADQIRGVCMLVSGGSGFCSGSLINNTANDGTPYVLSADHCYSNPSSVVYWFNWQSATCSNPGSSPPYNSISGATQIARNAATDFWLVELSSAPLASWNVYYSGWNRTLNNTLTGTAWGIHHPSGDIKKISWSDLGVSTTSYLQNPVPGDGTHWRVTQWSDGTTTEGGSSGSPLFDSNGHIIGQLHGGYASCSSMTSDWYGKLGVSWTGGGTNATRLSNWLDPLGTAPLVLDGFDPNQVAGVDAQMNAVTVPEETYCSTGNITPEVVIRNAGTITLTSATVSYTLNGGAPVNQNWTGSLATGATATVTFPQIPIGVGTHTFVSTVSNPNGTTDVNPANNSLTQNVEVFSFSIPFFEDFETGSVDCWSIEYVYGTTPWYLAYGGVNGNPSAAYSGSYNALFYINNYTAPVSKLITPQLNLSSMTSATLTFYHAMADWLGDLDELRVYYKNSASGSWNLLQTYNTNTTSWTLRTISLPSVTATYWVAFEGYANYGYGVCVDDVLIDGTTVGIDEEQQTAGIILHPNPAKDQFTLAFTKTDHNFDLITIRDINGKTVYSQNISSGTNSLNIDCSLFAAGVYMVTVHSENGNTIKKLIVQ